ncbi:MAG: 4Fe-4S dicluster domain-containing protein [Coriobacteriales bacterium]|jgi:formate hydrogenlyase subunit 6/NADH:ubiquinone oxidoreductase subunit I|nr:4Fe-4S dicluster domain-containing protein [Coriobacteriales bacterium]
MGSFHLTKMSFRNLFKKPATKMYPLVAPSYTSRSKGQVTIDIDDCILCGICQKRCPTHAIQVDKTDGSWTIDRFSCIQCLSCVRSCPKTCLTMAPAYAAPATQKASQTTKKPEV